MINDIIIEKYKAQADIARENYFDIKKISEEASKTVAELAKIYNIIPNYFDDLDSQDSV